MVIAPTTETKPTNKETLAPYSTLEKISRPNFIVSGFG
ncbi:hypothetical protein CGLO_13490 [Colletotrichum gloeosporioides Cg-14]|uniref:Uncharacterized protein n=1 Tax=Colletotrichum gloeosporioides (strain Cg-14) TaxID=1237896 RepID=T0L719_COLGC|nr:hypothetical protein CGLO_13490 [Colletotrichum gloeosporioides Cg-14]